MNIPDKIPDLTYALFEEWGPNRRIDRAVRLKQEFPALSDEEIQALIKEMKEVSAMKEREERQVLRVFFAIFAGFAVRIWRLYGSEVNY